MRGESDPVPIGQLAQEFAQALGIEFRAVPLDYEAIASDYISNARKSDARARFEVFQRENPDICSTDWARDHFDANRAALDLLKNWQFAKRGILASGPTGRGKTRALADLFRRMACDDGRDTRFFFAGDWFNKLQSCSNYGRDDARGWVEDCAARPLVIIDDLGQEAMQKSRADWAEAWFFRFLDIRIAKGLPLIISTNLNAKEIAGKNNGIRGDPLIRRLTDLCEVVKFV